jgi:4-carboxymuconolactone decarboxylase
MARISFPTPDTMDADQLRVYNKIISGRRGRIQGPLRAALYNAELADRWRRWVNCCATTPP